MLILLVVILLLCVLGFPAWPWSQPWGYRPFGGLILLLVVLVVVMAVGGGSTGATLNAHGCAAHW